MRAELLVKHSPKSAEKFCTPSEPNMKHRAEASYVCITRQSQSEVLVDPSAKGNHWNDMPYDIGTADSCQVGLQST